MKIGVNVGNIKNFTYVKSVEEFEKFKQYLLNDPESGIDGNTEITINQGDLFASQIESNLNKRNRVLALLAEKAKRAGITHMHAKIMQYPELSKLISVWRDGGDTAYFLAELEKLDGTIKTALDTVVSSKSGATVRSELIRAVESVS